MRQDLGSQPPHHSSLILVEDLRIIDLAEWVIMPGNQVERSLPLFVYLPAVDGSGEVYLINNPGWDYFLHFGIDIDSIRIRMKAAKG